MRAVSVRKRERAAGRRLPDVGSAPGQEPSPRLDRRSAAAALVLDPEGDLVAEDVRAADAPEVEIAVAAGDGLRRGRTGWEAGRQCNRVRRTARAG